MRAPLITEVIFWASRGSLERMQQIIDEHQLNVADESFADYDRRTPLALAAAEGYFRVCAWLLDKGAPVNMVRCALARQDVRGRRGNSVAPSSTVPPPVGGDPPPAHARARTQPAPAPPARHATP